MTGRVEEQEREYRIATEIVVDANDDEERAMGWYSYLQDTITWPWRARCVVSSARSPLHVGEAAEAQEMAPEDDCGHDMLVMITWRGRTFGVPLAQLEPHGDDVDEEACQAIEDWRYWVERGSVL